VGNVISGKEDLITALTEAFAMEKGTREFYAWAEEKADNADVKKTFGELAAWEGRHMEFLQYLYQSVMEDRDIEGFAMFEQRTDASVAEGGIPLDELQAKMEQQTFMDDRGAIQLALQVEGRAYNLYHGIAQTTEDVNARTVFEEMVAQEKKHVALLKEMEEKLEG